MLMSSVRPTGSQTEGLGRSGKYGAQIREGPDTEDYREGREGPDSEDYREEL